MILIDFSSFPINDKYMSNKGFSSILVVLLIVLFLGIVTLLFLQNIKDANNIKIHSALENTKSNTQLANPASVNCIKQGGRLSIQTLPNGSQYGLCTFEDNMQCEEWALFYGNCPVGGIKVTGFDTPAQVYCAIQGGETLAVNDASCTLPSGKVCNDEDLYNGKCSVN